MTTPPILQVSNLTAGYRASTVLHDVDIAVPRGGVAALLGPNGAGKTTLLRAVSGLIRPTSGSIRLDGTELVGLSAHQIVRRGVGHAPEGRRMFPYLTTEVNLRLGAFARRDRHAVEAEIDEHLDRWEVIGRRRHTQAGLLSGGEQQLVSLLRAVMSKPKVLLLDEPSLGLAPALVKRIYEVLKTLVQERHLSLLLVEQAAGQALEVADHVYVMSAGRIVFDAQSRDVTADDVVALYFGTKRHEEV